jgi:hypothetical protein
MDNFSRNQEPPPSDDRFPGESMLRRITNFGPDKNSNNTKHWMPDSAGKNSILSISIFLHHSHLF